LAFLRLKAGQWSQAQLALEAELRFGDDAELRLGLAQALLQQGQSAAAILHLERVSTLSGCPTALREAARAMLTQIRSEPSPGPSPARDVAAAHYAQAVDHAKVGRFADALPSFLAAAAAAPMRASYLKDVGHCLNDLNRPAEAQSWFERCLTLDPGYSQARWMLGQLAERAGRRDQAVAHYRDVLARTDSAQRDVDRAFDRLKALGGLPG
jgi:tetratricopeptide (TPR) repeat protein